MSYSPAQAVANARSDVGYREGNNNRNIFTPWQTRGRYNYQPWCASAVSKWSCDAGFVFDDSCVWHDRGDWNVGAQHQWGVRQGLARSPGNYRAQPGDLIVLSFTERDQHVELGIGDSGGNIATIGGNTNDMVAYRSRPRHQVAVIVALTQSSQVGAHTPPPHPKELLTMGMTPGRIVPGAHRQTKDPWKGRYPFVAAINNADGTADLCGFDGAVITGGKPAYGISIYHLGHVTKPLRSVDAIVDKHGNWDGTMTGLAEDGGDFTVAVHTEYL